MKLIKPKFWDKNYLTFQSLLLYPFTFLIDFKNLINFFMKPKKYSQIKTICVGNIYLGGTGKTPLVCFLAKILRKKFKIAIIKKKYKSHLDEKKLLEKDNKVFFDKNRKFSLLKAIEKNFELAIFDDGLQDKKIEYDLKIACFNSISLAGNELRLPSGPLRESLNNLRKYDAVFISEKPVNKSFLKKLKKINPKISIFNGEYVPTNFKRFKKKSYITFCGIGNPFGFARTLRKYGIKSESNLIYPDHYEYSETEINKIKKKAKEKNLKVLTTEKDFYRIPVRLRKNINYLKIDIKINNLKEFNKFLFKYL
tara:strand:+ start:209 stop:1138 length:930 start_codon:yes stop_codon:yes gene_type:complete